MSNRKALPEDMADQFFKGQSVFFTDQSQTAPVAAPLAPPAPPTPPPPAPTADSLLATNRQSQPASLPPVQQDVTIDVTTSILHNVDLKAWREQIETTETQNSSLRLTSEERYGIEDLINEVERHEKIKTSMNELARLGLLFLIHEFKQNGRKSILYRVKKA